jgi:PAS domain S-box-containing protein
MMNQILETKKMVRFEDERDGIWYDTVAYPIIVNTGEVKRIAIIARRDITERKMAEAALRESEQAFRRLVEQTFDAISIHKDKKIAFLNKRAVRILGAARPEDLIGRSIFEYIHPDSRKDLEDRLRNLSSAPGLSVPVMTEKFFRMDGTVVTVEVMAARFDDNGIPAVRVAFREISSPEGP